MDQAVTRLMIEARTAGYQVLHAEQLRTNRWTLVIKDLDGNQILVLAQQRPLIGSSDVQDLAELLQLQRIERGYLLAIGGNFSAFAQRTATELGLGKITLCTQLPSAGQSSSSAIVFGIA